MSISKVSSAREDAHEKGPSPQSNENPEGGRFLNEILNNYVFESRHCHQMMFNKVAEEMLNPKLPNW
jgi:hypothetical protein